MSQGYTIKLQTGQQAPGYFTQFSDPQYFILGENNNIVVDQLNLFDTAFEIYPSFNSVVSDVTGTFAETYPFIESLGMNIELGVDDIKDRNINHNFMWWDEQIQNTIISDHVGGKHIWRGVSHIRKEDNIKSRGFGSSSKRNVGLPWKTIVDQVISSYGFKTKVFEGTANNLIQNNDFEYQSSELDFDFLKRLANRASSSTNSPILTFINLKREFYFASLYTLLSQPVLSTLKFKMEVSDLQNFLPEDIQRYEISFAGAPFNENLYRTAMYNLDDTGKYRYSGKKIKDYFVKPQVVGNELGSSSNFVMMIRDQYTKELKSINYYGIVDNTNQKSNLDGWKSNKFIDSLTCYRKTITVPYNPDAVSGRTVELDFFNGGGSSNKSTLYAGKWLIWKSNHQYNRTLRSAWSTLFLLRQGTELDRNHPSFNDFSMNSPSPSVLS